VGIVVWHTAMSLDGFIAGPDDAMEWVFENVEPGPDPALEEMIAAIGALLVGKRTYGVGAKAGQPEEATKPYGGAWSGPQLVLAHDPQPLASDPDVTFLCGDIGEAVATARTAAAGKDVVVLGADVARQCLEAGLVDEILVHLAPVLLGDGVRLFERPASAPVKLEKIGVAETGQATQLRFRVTR
jgi:dihydrofolate reductase